MKFKYLIYATLILILILMNIVGTIILKNWYALLGWIVALLGYSTSFILIHVTKYEVFKTKK